MTPSKYTSSRSQKKIKIPLICEITLTQRCNNNCKHCWINLPADDPRKNEELSFSEISNLIFSTFRFGTSSFKITGGEPFLHPAILKILNLLGKLPVKVQVLTNGTMINESNIDQIPSGIEFFISLYGSNPQVHDGITRLPGSFEHAIRGIKLLQANDFKVNVQMVPLKGNIADWENLKKLIESLDSDFRQSALEIYLRMDGDAERNKEIRQQRIDPSTNIRILDTEHVDFFEMIHARRRKDQETQKIAIETCFRKSTKVTVSPYGDVTHCPYIVDKRLSFNLREFSFADIWEKKLPNLDVQRIMQTDPNFGTDPYKNLEFRVCETYSYLESGLQSYFTRVDYYVDIQQFMRSYIKNKSHEYTKLADFQNITIMMISEIRFQESTFNDVLNVRPFNQSAPYGFTIKHHLSDLKLSSKMGEMQYEGENSVIFQKDPSIYSILVKKYPSEQLSETSTKVFSYHGRQISFVAVLVLNISKDTLTVHHSSERIWRQGNLKSLNGYIDDQTWWVLVEDAKKNKTHQIHTTSDDY